MILTDILCEKYAVPAEFATEACKKYLRSFRKCPDNIAMNLDDWRILLWTEALCGGYEHIADDVYQIWLDLRYNHLALPPEIHHLLQKLREYYLVGLITNGPSSAQWEKIDRLNLKIYFDIILVSGDLPWEKPHHGIFHAACAHLGVDPHHCVMVGDKLETDILGGIRADFGATVWVPLNGADVDDADPTPDYVLQSVVGLPDLLPKNTRQLGLRTRCASNGRPRPISLADYEDSLSNSSDGS